MEKSRDGRYSYICKEIKRLHNVYLQQGGVKMVVKCKQDVEQIVNQYKGKQVLLGELLVDRHPSDKIACYYESDNGDERTYTYGELSTLSKKFAQVLQDKGVQKGDAVAVLLSKGPEVIISLLAIWRLGAVQVPLFTAFGPEAIEYRVTHSGANVIITNDENRSKLMQLQDKKVITIDCDDKHAEDFDFWSSIDQASPLSEDTKVEEDDLFILIYTSGTTGHPKGVEVPVRALAAFESYMRFGLDVQPSDTFWNIADPGWAYGLYYGIVGPLLVGRTFVVYRARFTVQDTYRILAKYNVTNFAAAPTVYRTMRVEEVPEIANKLSLRVLSSAGEPLNYDIAEWAKKHLGLPIYDHYGQTELGMAINNHHHESLHVPVRPGSMGEPLPGYHAVILNGEGEEQPAGVEGQIAIDTEKSPVFWFRGYKNDEAKTAKQFMFNNRYYLTSDSASRDEDYHFYFSGRADDIITSSGYKIGPFEVESSLMGHEAVAETTVIGVPDPQRGEIVKAFIVLREGYTPSEALKEELSTFVKSRLSAHEYPRAIEFLAELPKTPSGKIQRFLLR